MKNKIKHSNLLVCSCLLFTFAAFGQSGNGPSYEDLLNGFTDSGRWLTYSGDYSGKRHSPLKQITPDNIDELRSIWTFQSGTTTRGRGWEGTPLLDDGVLYVTGSNNYAWALDARTGRSFWEYRRNLPDDLTYGASAPVNRGFGMLGNQLFMVTLDAHLMSFDRRTGEVLWERELADYQIGYSATLAPLILDNKVIVGISGGEYQTRGFIDAFDPVSGERIWRFNTIPGPGEPGSETWPEDPQVLAQGGGGTWMNGSFDPDLNLIYWGVGNPNPDYYDENRPGDNLYTDSIVALDADSGELRWHYQFTPHDVNDWDSNHMPVLANIEWQGESRRVVMVGNRNGFFYVLDRVTGEFLLGEPFTATTWAREIGDDGRPIVVNDGSLGCLPDPWGSTNFYPPTFFPGLDLFILTARETCATYVPEEPADTRGQSNFGGTVFIDTEVGYGALRALDVHTGQLEWEFRYPSPTFGGVMSTASGLVFAGDHEGNFMAFDAESGENLWHYQTGSRIWGAAAITYMLDGLQYVMIPSGTTLTAFALRNPD